MTELSARERQELLERFGPGGPGGFIVGDPLPAVTLTGGRLELARGCGGFVPATIDEVVEEWREMVAATREASRTHRSPGWAAVLAADAERLGRDLLRLEFVRLLALPAGESVVAES